MVWLVVALVVVGVVFILGMLVIMLVVGPKLVLRSIRPSLEARAHARHPAAEDRLLEDYTAASFGLESLGRLQSRGNGALVLSPSELTFFQYRPERAFVIPLGRITAVELTRSHLGKATPRKIVRVRFTDDAGDDDSLGVYVHDAEDVKDRISELMDRPSSD